MGRIVVNKHFDNISQITNDKFVNKGEIIVSNQVGYEGIFIINKNGEKIYIGPYSGSSSVANDYKDYVINYVTEELKDYFTAEETINWVNENVSTSDKQIQNVVEKEIEEALSSYPTTDDVNDILKDYSTTEYVSNLLGDFCTENYVDEKLSIYPTTEEVSSMLSDCPTLEEVRNISREEVNKIVNGADASYDTLKEISDWILNDETGAASMVNEISALKAQLNALILKDAKATASVSPNIIEKGVESQVTVIGNISPTTLKPYTVSIFKNNEEKATASNNSVSFQDRVNTTTSYDIKATYNDVTYTTTTRVNAYNRTYYGFGIDYNAVISNGNSKVTSSAKGAYADVANDNGVYYFILVPEGVTAPTTFVMGGAPFNMNKSTEILNGIKYTVLKSGSIFNNGGEVNITAS